MRNLILPTKPRIAIHKFASCDGCQLAFINLGPVLLTLAERVEIVHFAEAGPVEPEAPVDIAFIEGSISTAHDIERIKQIRAGCSLLVSIGACATSGGIQALKNGQDVAAWTRAIYAQPNLIETLASSDSVDTHVKVDFELWGCPIGSDQIVCLITSLLQGVAPEASTDSVCMACKQRGLVCVLVSGQLPCMGPVTRTGCGALCPAVGRACYGCFGPANQVNHGALARIFAVSGLTTDQVVERFNFINGQAEPFANAVSELQKST
jgi:coenzyme F420-reducing hydrogenase gamma subunit